MPVGTPIAASEEELALVKYGPDGLVPAIVQDHATGDILMFAWMRPEDLRDTLESGAMTYWSRSRQERWVKGETSGDLQWLREAYYDCDADVLLFKIDQDGGGACHTGNRSCFYRAFGSGAPTDA
jgi:phosphoribosyl-AMP cyclohydrolase/phosphoribosyl-ATP pyrophosphohydrolase/phosphoribosyl-AMP cyclohydrolase